MWWRVLLALSLMLSAGAKASTDVDSLAKDFEATKKKLEAEEIKQRQVLSALYQLNKKIKKIVTEKGELSQQRAFLEVGVRNLTAKVEELDQKSKQQRLLLGKWPCLPKLLPKQRPKLPRPRSWPLRQRLWLGWKKPLRLGTRTLCPVPWI